MIFDKTEHADRYFGISSNLDTALAWMMKTDLSSLECGSYPIDGEEVFVKIMNAQTNPDAEREYEYHNLYFDIQIDIKGREDVLFGTEYRKLTRPLWEDIGFGDCDCRATAHLTPGMFVICWPMEPHLPGTSPVGKPEQIKKAVIKVRKQG